MDKDASVSARSERLANVTFDDLLAAMNDEAAYLRRHPHDAGAVEDTRRAAAALVEFTSLSAGRNDSDQARAR